MRRKTIPIVVAVSLLTGGVVLAWKALDWPPPRLIVTYGFPPAHPCLTGRTVRLRGSGFVSDSFASSQGFDPWEQFCFVEISTGYRHVRRKVTSIHSPGKSSLPWPLSALFSTTIRGPGHIDQWVEIPECLWITKGQIYDFPPECSPFPALRDYPEHVQAVCDVLTERYPGAFRRATYGELCVSSAVQAPGLSGRSVECDPNRWLQAGEEPIRLSGNSWAGFDGTAVDVEKLLAEERRKWMAIRSSDASAVSREMWRKVRRELIGEVARIVWVPPSDGSGPLNQTPTKP